MHGFSGVGNGWEERKIKGRKGYVWGEREKEQRVCSGHLQSILVIQLLGVQNQVDDQCPTQNNDNNNNNNARDCRTHPINKPFNAQIIKNYYKKKSCANVHCISERMAWGGAG